VRTGDLNSECTHTLSQRATTIIMFEPQTVFDQNVAKPFSPSARAASAEIKPVDLRVLLSFEELRQANETDLVVDLIDLYLQDAPVKINAIQRAIERADAESLRQAAHSLKGSSGTLGVCQLASLCEELECLADAGLDPGANAMLHRLEEEFVRVQEVLISELHRRRSSA
jgi:HPt (histidine-containing phosphotransfer) domain-containing protein